jgi:cell division protein FtsB
MIRGEGRGFDLKRQLRLSAWPVVAVLLTGYFGYHLAYGSRGLLAYSRLEAKVSAARLELVRAEETRRESALRVDGLRVESLDRDLLEERARILLNMGLPGELIIPNDAAPNPIPPRHWLELRAVDQAKR